MAELSIVLPDERAITVAFGQTVEDVITTILKDSSSNSLVPTSWDEESLADKSKFALVEVALSSDVASKETILPRHEKIAAIQTRWSHLEQEGIVQLVQVRRSFQFKLVHVDQFIIVNFNTFFRMANGISEQNYKLFVTPKMTVEQVNNAIFKHLKIQPDLSKMGLFGAEKSDGIANRELDSKELALVLKNTWETPEPSFFQFQTKADLSASLGTDKQGWLEKEGMNVKSWKTRWFQLKGTSLFYYKDQKDTKPLGQIADIDKAQIREIEHPFDDTKPTGKKSIFSTLKGTPLRPKGLYFFEIVLPNRTWRLSAPDQQTIKDWIEAIDDAAKRQLSREAAYSAPQETIKVKPIASDQKLVDSANVSRVVIPNQPSTTYKVITPAPPVIKTTEATDSTGASAGTTTSDSLLAIEDKRVSVVVFEMDDEPEVALPVVAADSTFANILENTDGDTGGFSYVPPVTAAAAAVTKQESFKSEPVDSTATSANNNNNNNNNATESATTTTTTTTTTETPKSAQLATERPISVISNSGKVRMSTLGASFDQLEGMLNDLNASLDETKITEEN